MTEEPSWEGMLKLAAQKLIEQGPVVILLVGMLAIVGLIMWKVVWPWVTGFATQALAESRASREQRLLELEHDKRDKAELHKTARLIAVKVDEQGERLDKHGKRIDGLADEVRTMPERVAQRVADLRNTNPRS